MISATSRSKTKKWLYRSLQAFAGVAVLSIYSTSAVAKDYGSPGDPVNLTVGYQPYYTESWSGVVMRAQKLYEKYLPEGSEVQFQIGLQGSIIVNAMLAGKQDIGYMGDMPAIVSTTKTRVADLRMVSVLGLGWDQCNNFLVRTDAPEFSSGEEAIEWMDGKRVAVPKGACTDRFARAAFRKLGVEPANYLNQNIEVITSGFKAKKIDAAAIWEPTAAKLVEQGLARRVATGRTVEENDGGFMVMRADLIKQRPDVVRAWLKAELDALQLMANPDNASQVAAMAQQQTEGFSHKELWMSFAGPIPEAQGGGGTRVILPYGFTPRAKELLERATAFLHNIKSINVSELRDEAVMEKWTEEILEQRGITPNVGEVSAQAVSMRKEP